jgi:hypothetical protein
VTCLNDHQRPRRLARCSGCGRATHWVNAVIAKLAGVLSQHVVRAQNRRMMIDESVPKSLTYALQDKAAMQVAYVRVEQHDMHIVVEPGHDSELIWKGLVFLLKIEGLTDGESTN